MRDLSEECIGLLTNGYFQITDPGPLRQPIRSFSIRRDDKLRLVLETNADPNATSSIINKPPGAIRVNTDSARLRSIGGLEGEFFGVIPYSVLQQTLSASEQTLKELAQVHIAKITNPAAAHTAYIIDWFENLPNSPYMWPASSEVVTETVTTRRISLDGGITIASDRKESSTSKNCAKLTVDGVTLYVCALDSRDRPGAIKPGCIVYDGTPDDGFRKKVRIALSFALGLYFVELGTTHYDSKWRIVSTLARSAYSLGHQAFDIPTLQFAPLGPTWQNELTAAQLTRAVQAFVTGFDSLDLANIHWAFWHACVAPPHIAPAHFGAAIEGLQSAYIKANPRKVREGYLPRDGWKALKMDLSSTIDRASIPDEAKTSLKGKLNTFNHIDQRERLKEIMAVLNLQLGDDEDAAWRRRNKAAHGTPIPEGQEVEAIRDVKLLRGLFQRLLLRLTNAAEQYIDYASLGHDYRYLHLPPPNAPAPQPQA